MLHFFWDTLYNVDDYLYDEDDDVVASDDYIYKWSQHQNQRDKPILWVNNLSKHRCHHHYNQCLRTPKENQMDDIMSPENVHGENLSR